MYKLLVLIARPTGSVVSSFFCLIVASDVVFMYLP